MNLPRRRVLAHTGAIALAASALFGTSAIHAQGLGTAAAPVSIRMIANEAFAKQWQTAMVPEFNKSFPHIKVQIDGVPYPELLAKSLLDVTGPSPTYDIIIADDPWIPALAQTGALLDLKKDAAAWTAADFDWNDFNAAPLAASEWNGKQYGVPLRSNMLLMFTNKKLYEKGVKALQAHIDLLKFAPPGAASHGFNESLQAFRQGQVATMFMWGSVFKGTAVDAATTTLTPEQVGIQVMPVGSSGAGAHRGIWSGAITNKSKQQQAAWALLQWLSSRKGELWHANTLGVFPARKSTLATPPESPWLVPVYSALQQAYEVAAAGQMWRPRLVKSDAVQQILADETARAVSGQITAEKALQNAAERIERTVR